MKYILNAATRSKVLDAISRLHPAKPWEIEVNPYVPLRTLEQNARLWALHTKASEVTGYTPEEMHELALGRFFGVKRMQLGDEVVIWRPKKRSSTRDRKEFADFMASTEEFYIQELGVWLD